MKKILVSIVLLLSCLTLSFSAFAKMSFTDIGEDAWYYEAVDYVYKNNVMVGITDTEFEPDKPTNRAMVVAILARLANADLSDCTETAFVDVEVDAWYGKSVIWAQRNGIVAGMSETEFAPYDNITREQMCLMLSNYLDFIGLSTAAPETEPFSDVDMVSSWARGAVERLQKAGIVSGRDNNVFDPQGIATRAEIAQIVRSSNLADVKPLTPENKDIDTETPDPKITEMPQN